ncbi:hypothetical protein [Serratia liquefaciens]|uniref:hypothetical protein n=1 Tax=Serratia liquefaciens TaxID=614 RepID=UPI000DFD9EE7|nr:hypothetical protein [Serratia liquefaciens]SUI62240.1 Uncharacterised protein [Serratia liquefaciens]
MIEVKKPTEEELRDFTTRKFLEEQFNKSVEAQQNKKINEYKKRLHKITPTLFRQFLTDKGVPFRCPSCGSDDLSVPESFTMQSNKIPGDFLKLPEDKQEELVETLTDSHVSYVTLGNMGPVTGLIKSYYQVHCLNCGHLSLYRSATVLNWLKKIDKVGEKE